MTEPRFLLIRFSAIGDCVMAAWAATSIRAKHPEAFLCWAVESRCAPVINRQSLTSRVYEFPRDRWKKRRWSPATWREQVLAYANLRRLRFDYGIDLQGHSKTALCLRIAAPMNRVQARATDGLAKRLNPMVGEPMEGTHAVEWNQRVLRTLGDFELPSSPIMPEVGDEKDGQLVTISVSAGQVEKAYPADQWRDVATDLIRSGYRVAFLGGPTDRSVEVDGADDYVGRLSLDKTMAMVASSRLHLCADTGTGHMAAAYGVPVVSVFGPTDPAVYRPFTDRGTVLKVSERTSNVSAGDVLAAARGFLE